MAEYLKLKSRALEIIDPREIDITAFIPAFEPDEAQINKDTERILKAHGQKAAADTVAEGDMAVVEGRSTLEKYNRTVTVMVGRGLYGREAEQALLGQPVGSTVTVTLPEGEARLTVRSCTRTVLPSLTDENVAAFGLEGVSTVKDLRRYCIDRQIARLLDDYEPAEEAAARIWQELCKRSIVELDPQEEALARRQGEEHLESVKNSIDMEAAREEGYENPEDVYGFFRELYLTELRSAAMGQKIAEEEGRLLTPEDYEEYLRRREAAVPDKPREELLREYPAEIWLREQYGELCAMKIDEYVSETFKRAMNPEG